MLGTVRFLLAVMVAANHLWLPVANKVGAHAVAAFYVISGYLMTKIIQETYGTDMDGVRRFLLNRWLRIYPPYLLVLSLSVALLLIFPDTFGRTYSNMILPHTLWNSFRNVTLIYLPTSPEIVVPPAWTLWVECSFYVA